LACESKRLGSSSLPNFVCGAKNAKYCDFNPILKSEGSCTHTPFVEQGASDSLQPKCSVVLP